MGSLRHPVRRLAGGIAAALAAAATLAAPAHATTTIDTVGGWDGSQYFWPFGAASAGNTATYGQTVTVPASDNQLQSFSFQLDVPTDVPLRGEVYGWDDATQTVTGGELWGGAATTTTSYDPAGGHFQTVGFDTGGLGLSPGQQVVLFVTTLRDPSSDGAYGYAGARWGSTDPYPGGEFVYSNDAGFTSLLSDRWGSFDGGFFPHADLAFRATFGSSYVLRGFPGSDPVAKAGQNVPVTWTLTAGNGAPVTDASAMSLSSAPCGGGDATVASPAGGSGWQSDGAGGWQVNWKTQKAWAGTCRTLTLTLPDGSASSVRFSFR